jgi:ATP-dependent Zn protease
MFVAMWISLVGALVVLFSLLNRPGGGSSPWVISLIVSWLPFLALVGVWLWLSRRNLRSSSGTNWVDLYEQQIAENRRTNALLERIAVALEKPSPG